LTQLCLACKISARKRAGLPASEKSRPDGRTVFDQQHREEGAVTNWNKLRAERVEQNGVEIYRLSGALTSSPEAYTFLETLTDRVHQGGRRFVINLGRVEPLTSAGVGILAACYTSVTNQGGKLRLAQVPARARVILNVVHLLELLGDLPSEEEAVRSVAG
jgi:anti-anti-sigma factor